MSKDIILALDNSPACIPLFAILLAMTIKNTANPKNVIANQKLTAKDMTALLNAHYVPENKPSVGIFAAEIGSPDGKRFADAIWQSTTRSGGMLLVGHEIKVSRADVMIELADPSKAESWMQYCDQWWLTISDPKLIDGLIIPETWGVMSPPSGRRKRSMTIIKEAPMLRPITKEDGLLRLLTWQASKNITELTYLKTQNQMLENSNNSLKNIIEKHGIADNYGTDERNIQSVIEKMRELEKSHSGRGSFLSKQTLDSIAETAFDLKKSREAEQLATNTALRIIQSLDVINGDIERAKKVVQDLNVKRLNYY